MDLVIVAHFDIGSKTSFSLDKRNLPDDGLDKSRFPDPIWSYNSDRIHLADIQIDRLGQDLIVIANGRLFYCQNDIARGLIRMEGHMGRLGPSFGLV